MTGTIQHLVVIICPDDLNYATQALLDCVYKGEIPFQAFLMMGKSLKADELHARHDIMRQVIRGYATAMAVYTDMGVSQEMMTWMRLAADAKLRIQLRSFQDIHGASPWVIDDRPVLTAPDGTKVAL